uniref:Bulb-type lectin domain-containing protein n=1 Tax=Amphimedon queenslandica TaxID=400682 RepID=A0A1X7SFW2_AMPQE
MGFVVGALFVLSLSFGAVLAANDPMPPKIPETFSSWTFGLSLDDDGNVIATEDGGYIARDMLGNRVLFAGSVTTSNTSYSYSNLALCNKNLTYHTYWDEDGNRTCYVFKFYSPGLMPMWDWIQNASYMGSDFGADVWAYF